MKNKIIVQEEKKQGIYIIVNQINEKIYVGSTNNFEKRKIAHINNLVNIFNEYIKRD